MGEINIVSPGKARGYPYAACKNNRIYDRVEAETRKSWANFQIIKSNARLAEHKT